MGNMARRKAQTVLEHCVAALGVHKGALAAASVAQWAIAAHELEHVPTTVEYVEFWYCTERTGWNHRAAIRSVFGDDWPSVVEALAADIGDRLSPRAVANRPVAVYA
jgi:hypothetical protein